MNLDDTIVAISSPPGASPRGIVRISGPDARRITARYFHADSGSSLVSTDEARVMSGRVTIGDASLPACAYLFNAPRSYTHQDIVELHLLGAPGVLGMLIEQCLTAGARSAEPGEFTARAFLAGALDLSQVHGIAGMIAARSDHQLQAAARLLHGALSRNAQAAREELADLISLIEGAMDFADEPIEFISPADLRRRLVTVRDALESTAAAGLRAERWGELPRVLLAGSPNVGKSSLLNRLTGLDRAICAPVAGTTRDVLTAPLDLGDFECLLMDVAGLGEPASELDATAQSAARTAIQSADLVLNVFDASKTREGESKTRRGGAPAEPNLIVLNKCDLLGDLEKDDLRLSFANAPVNSTYFVSAVTGEGCDALTLGIAQALRDRPVDINDSAIALVAEHRQALADALNSLASAIELAERAGDNLTDADLVAAELHAAAAALAVLVGRDDTEDLLGRIFSRFCVGK
jgi:tRNA modification GTPase